MRMQYPRHLKIGPADSPEGSSELVKLCQVSQQWWKWVDISLGQRSSTFFVQSPPTETLFENRPYLQFLRCLKVLFCFENNFSANEIQYKRAI